MRGSGNEISPIFESPQVDEIQQLKSAANEQSICSNGFDGIDYSDPSRFSSGESYEDDSDDGASNNDEATTYGTKRSVKSSTHQTSSTLTRSSKPHPQTSTRRSQKNLIRKRHMTKTRTRIFL